VGFVPEDRPAVLDHGGVCFDTVIAIDSKPRGGSYVEPQDLHWDVGRERDGELLRRRWGDLRMLRQTMGAFDVATWGCAGRLER
jgi:hypothetical protein